MQRSDSSALSTGAHDGFLRVASWNVAGWSTTAENVRRMYGGRLSAFLQSLRCDILCLQEVKGTGGVKKLKSDPVASGASDASGSAGTIPGWDTFWAHSAPQHRGFNGVAVFAKSGLVVAADAAPLRVPELDDEGRCILAVTRHFAVFSVYAPARSGGGARHELRVRFFHALAAAVQRVRRELELPVVLCGDLNATYRAADVHWSWRLVSLPRLRGEKQPPPRATLDPRQDSKRQQTETTPQTKKDDENDGGEEEPAIQWPVWMPPEFRKARVQDIESIVALRAATATEEAAKKVAAAAGSSVSQQFGADQKDDEGRASGGGGAPEAAEDEPRAQQTVFGLHTFLPSDLTSHKARQWYNVAMSPAVVQPRPNFITDVLVKQTGLVDSLVAVHGDEATRCLFTCFNQSRNERYYGIGQRIDYVLCDAALLPPRVLHPPPTVAAAAAGANPNGPPPEEFSGGALTQRLLAAASCRGTFIPVPHTGGADGGMSRLERGECEDALRTCFLPANPDPQRAQQPTAAGVLYTPPQLSDHVAVYCDLARLPPSPSRSAQAAQHVQAMAEATRQCRYDSGVKSIASFFVAAAAGARSQPASKALSKEAPQTRQRGDTVDDCIEID